MITEDVLAWRGRELPVWSYAHWKDVEHFVDTLCPQDYVLTINPELQPEVTGLVFSQDPTTAANAVAAFRITTVEPECGP